MTIMFESLSKLHTICFPSKPWAATDFAELKKSGAEIIASDNAFIVYRIAADECEIITIGVAPNVRRTGTATALLRIMESELKKSDTKSVFLEVSDMNAPAIDLYLKLGYDMVGKRPGYYDGTDAIIMKKSLVISL